MESESKGKGRLPDYKGYLEVAGWKMEDKNGKTFLSLNISNHVNLFKNEPKPKKPEAVKDI
jgi:hypothetical protein